VISSPKARLATYPAAATAPSTPMVVMATLPQDEEAGGAGCSGGLGSG
jgi:hypothetical protein